MRALLGLVLVLTLVVVCPPAVAEGEACSTTTCEAGPVCDKVDDWCYVAERLIDDATTP